MKKKVYPYTRPNTTKVKDCHTPKQSDKAKVQKVGKWGIKVPNLRRQELMAPIPAPFMG